MRPPTNTRVTTVNNNNAIGEKQKYVVKLMRNHLLPTVLVGLLGVWFLQSQGNYCKRVIISLFFYQR